MPKLAVRILSGTSLEGPARRAYNSVRARVPAALLSAAAAKALAYDQMTLRIARQVLADGGSAIDVGAHEGEILGHLVKLSAGPHWAFEPIPAFASRLRRRFPRVTVSDAALSDHEGEATFRFIPGSAAYSSLFTRPEVERGQRVAELRVQVRKLDDCVPESIRIAFLKIDVEGAEAAVLRGARGVLTRWRPVTVFECASAGLPDCITALEGTGLRVSFLADYLAASDRSADEVVRLGRENGEYYYVAHPARA